MVSNRELFVKVMKFSRELRMSAGAPFKGPFPPPMMPGMPPPPFGRPGRHHMPPHGFGPKRPGMAREHMLVIINEYPDGIRQKELAEQAGINASSTSEVVTKLEDDGYLVRTIDPNDKRATVLKLTEMGKVRASEIRSERDLFLDDYFGKLTDDQKQALSDLLDKLMKE